MAREQWAKVDVDMPTDEKLFGRPLLERHLWTCLICLSKKNWLETGDFTIYNLDASALNKRFNLGSTAGVEAGLKYFATCKPRPILKRKDGAIHLLNVAKRQAPSKDNPESVAARMRDYRARNKSGVTGNVTGQQPVTNTRNGSVTRYVEGEGEEEKDPRSDQGEEIPSRASAEARESAPPQAWDSVLLAELRTALGKDESDSAFAGFLVSALKFPRQQRESATREFLSRGCAADGKGPSYLLAMIRDGAGMKRGASNGAGKPDGKANGNASPIPKWKQQGASSPEEYERWLADGAAHA